MGEGLSIVKNNWRNLEERWNHKGWNCRCTDKEGAARKGWTNLKIWKITTKYFVKKKTRK